MDLLKLTALDNDDLSVISAHLQDAVLLIGDIRYLPDQQRFVLIDHVKRYILGLIGQQVGIFRRERAATPQS